MTSRQLDDLGDARWKFRNAPDDGGRDYGNANLWTVPPDLETLIREVGQNSLDHPARRGEPVHMRFRLIELTKDGDHSDAFMQALDFGSLKSHIEEAANTNARLASRLQGGLRRLRDPDRRLRLLRIDDFGTTGLFGSETAQGRKDNNPFAALVRNQLDSSKQSSTAGGSFGLGKAVLWGCSELFTVLFASDIVPERRDEEQEAGVRFMGKAELTWHMVGSDSFAGPGWLGGGKRPDSLWLDDDDLRKLHLNRDDLPPGVEGARDHGTTALVVGFRDPEEEEHADPSYLIRRMAKAAAVNFWPVIMRGGLRVSLDHVVDDRVKEQIREVDPIDYVPELCETLVRYDQDDLDEELTEEGDVVRIPITHRIPHTEEDADQLEHFPDDLNAEAHLLVRQAGTEAKDEKHLEHVALVRGREMVVKYWRRSHIVVGGRPFHAILLAGEACGSDRAQRAADQFLRISEPPAHDDWEFNDEVRENFARGGKTRLKELFSAVTESLRPVIKPSESEQDEGPRELRRLLQLSTTSTRRSAAATLRSTDAVLRDGAWVFDGEIHVTDRERGWVVTPRLRIDVESGQRIRVPWRELSLGDVTRGTAELRDGTSIAIGPRTRRIPFRAISTREVEGIHVARCKTVLDLQVDPSEQTEGED